MRVDIRPVSLATTNMDFGKPMVSEFLSKEGCNQSRRGYRLRCCAEAASCYSECTYGQFNAAPLLSGRWHRRRMRADGSDLVVRCRGPWPSLDLGPNSLHWQRSNFKFVNLEVPGHASDFRSVPARVTVTLGGSRPAPSALASAGPPWARHIAPWPQGDGRRRPGACKLACCGGPQRPQDSDALTRHWQAHGPSSLRASAAVPYPVYRNVVGGTSCRPSRA
jgi:hypothetical protein